MGEKLGKMDVEKKQCVAVEDFEKAHLIKLKMDEYRLHMYKELHVNDLLDVAGAFNLPRAPKDDLDPRNRSPKLKVLRATPDLSPPPHTRSFGRQSHLGAAEHAFDDPEVSAYQRYEERPLPALANKGKKQNPNPDIKEQDESVDAEGDEGEGVPEDGADSVLPTERTEPHEGVEGDAHAELEPLDERDLREAGPIIDVFGLQSVTKAFSKTWSYRENAILAVLKQMEELDKNTPAEEAKTMYHAAVFLVKKAIADPVFAVYRSGLTLLQMMNSQFTVRFKIPKSETQYCLEKCIPPLLSRFNDTSQRVRDLAKKSIMEQSDLPEVKSLNYIPPECLRTFKSITPPRVATLRAELAENLYKKFRLSNGITVENLATFCMCAMDHPSGEVHEPAIRILCQLQKETGNSSEFRSLVNLNNDTLLKKPNYRKLAELLDAGTTTLPKHGADTHRNPDSHRPQPEKKTKPKPAKPMPSKKTIPVDDESPRDDDHKEEDDRASVILSNMCIFCLEKNEAFDEKGLNIHYFTACPMLRKCEHCNEVIEVSGLRNHWLNDCSGKELYAKCETCQDTVLVTDLDLPKHKRACRPMVADFERCPMCLTDVEAGNDTEWRQHLMGARGCPANPRRVTGAAGGARIKQRQAVLAANSKPAGRTGRK